MTDITFDCPHCGKGLDVDAEGAGLEVPCPSCGNTITIPSPEESANDQTTAAHAPSDDSFAESGTIIFDCPHCGKGLDVDAEGAGLEVPCPSCGNTITIPYPDEAEEMRAEAQKSKPPEDHAQPAEVVNHLPQPTPAPVHIIVPQKAKAQPRKPKGTARSNFAHIREVQHKSSALGLLTKWWIGLLLATFVASYFVSNNVVKLAVFDVAKKYDLPLGSVEARFLYHIIPFQLELQFPSQKLPVESAKFAAMLTDIAAATGAHPVESFLHLKNTEVNYYSVSFLQNGKKLYMIPGGAWRSLGTLKGSDSKEIYDTLLQVLSTDRGAPIISVTRDSSTYDKHFAQQSYAFRSQFCVVTDAPPKESEPKPLIPDMITMPDPAAETTPESAPAP